MTEVEQWKKRLRRKGPFYLYEVDHFDHTKRDFSTTPPTVTDVIAKSYRVIWNDGEKTKIGYLEDYMYCRHGIKTQAVLNGDSPFDLWNGANVDQKDFNEMLAVREHRSKLPTFDLDTLVGLVH